MAWYLWYFIITIYIHTVYKRCAEHWLLCQMRKTFMRIKWNITHSQFWSWSQVGLGSIWQSFLPSSKSCASHSLFLPSCAHIEWKPLLCFKFKKVNWLRFSLDIWKNDNDNDDHDHYTDKLDSWPLSEFDWKCENGQSKCCCCCCCFCLWFTHTHTWSTTAVNMQQIIRRKHYGIAKLRIAETNWNVNSTKYNHAENWIFSRNLPRSLYLREMSIAGMIYVYTSESI